MQSEQRCSGVRLMDVLAVILIVFGVAAVMRPAVLKAHKGELAACKSNLRQLGIGLLQYSQDYDQHWPGGGGHWAGDIYPYEKNAAVYKCPSDSVAPADGFEVSYAMNSNQQGPKGGNATNALSFPARTVATIEYDRDSGGDRLECRQHQQDHDGKRQEHRLVQCNPGARYANGSAAA